jgi:hypothetical protein
MDDEQIIKHPAFGKISLSHVQGRRNLFMVDYPQGHFVTLRLKRAELHRNLSNDWVFGGNEIIEIAMSQVQWAQFLSSPNTEGVPCTLEHYFDHESGKMIQPRLPEKHVADSKKYAEEVAETARDAAKRLDAALKKAEEILSGKTVKKGDVEALKNDLFMARQELKDNLPFVVQQAEEKIEASVESAKGEVAAHTQFILTRLGERVLGERLEQIVAAGGDVAQIGEAITTALLPKSQD